MKLIVGLGNPGEEYNNTRHNIGFILIDEFLNKHNLKTEKEKFSGKYVDTIINKEKIYFLKPQTFMNLSGTCVLDFINYYKINIEDILVIHDDIDSDLGIIRLKQKGSCGGHNGIRNIIDLLGTEDFKRLKIGVSKNKDISTSDYVLGKFKKEEKEVLDKIKNKAVEIIEDYLKIDYDELMKKYNTKGDK